MIKETIGNIDLLKLSKTAFLCSRKIPASVVLKCYDWAVEQRESGGCVISGFHSQIEKDVLHYLLKGKQPIILALARGLKEKVEPEFEKTFGARQTTYHFTIRQTDKTCNRTNSRNKEQTYDRTCRQYHRWLCK